MKLQSSKVDIYYIVLIVMQMMVVMVIMGSIIFMRCRMITS